MPQLSFVIVEYHGLDDVRNAINSIRRHVTGLDYDIIVASNSEYDQARLSEICQSFEDIRFASTGANEGYAAGVNYGVAHSEGDYVFLFNPDAELVSGGFDQLVDYMEDNPSVAILGPRVTDDADVVQPSCRRFPKWYTFLLVRSFLRRFFFSRREQARYLMEDFERSSTRQVDWVSGGALLIRRSAAESIGGMDDRYFLYMEDVDWCKRARDAGWQVVYNPSVTIKHAGQHSSIQGGFLKQTQIWHLKSLMKYFFKHGFFS